MAAQLLRHTKPGGTLAAQLLKHLASWDHTSDLLSEEVFCF